MKAILKKLLLSLKSNWLIKIIAVVFALIIWSYVMTETNPMREKTITAVPISYTNVEQLEAKALAISGNLDDILSNVNVTVSVGQKYSASISANTIKATIDMSTINGTGTYNLPIQTTLSSTVGTITGVNPETVSVYVEDLVQKFIPVETIIMGKAPEGYYFETPTVSPEQIEIAGARSDISRIARAVCYVFVSDVEENIHSSFNLSLLDDSGNVIDDSVLKDYLPSVIVSMDVYKTKVVPIDLKSAIKDENKLKKGFELTSIDIQPSSVTIAADDAVLDKITTLWVDPISIAGASGDVTMTTSIRELEGVIYMSALEAKITAHISEETQTRSLTVPLTVVDMPNELRLTSPSELVLSISGPRSLVVSLKAADFSAIISAKGLTVGKHDVPVVIKAPDGITTSPASGEKITISLRAQN